MIEDTHDHLNTTTLQDLIDNSIPQLISDGAILDQQTFGSPDNRDILEHVILATRDGLHDEVQVADEMVAAEMLRPAIFRPAFFNLILTMYQKWSTKWHRYNPEHPPDSDSASSRSRSVSPDLHSLLREHSQSAHSQSALSSRGGSHHPSGTSRSPSRAPSRPPSRDSREHPWSDRRTHDSDLAALLHQIKMIYTITK